jgi:hypothetical protein
VAAVGFLRELHRCLADAPWRLLAPRWDDLGEAYALYTEEPSWPRWELEARLLTDQPLDEIAVRLDTSPAVVDAYHATFFDVRGRLRARGWVANHVPGLGEHVPLVEEDVGGLLKLYAYTGGPTVLDALLEYFQAPPDPNVLPELLDADARAALRGKLRIRAAIVPQLQPVDGPSTGRLLGVLDRVGKKLRQAEDAATTARMLTAVLKGGEADAPGRGVPTKSEEKGDAAA